MEKLENLQDFVRSFQLPVQLVIAWQVAMIWGFNILVALDQLINTVFWGDPDETISSRAAKAKISGRCWGCFLCFWLDWIDPKHCQNAIEHDEGKNSVMATWQRRKEEGAT